jgi:hypothetical protein
MPDGVLGAELLTLDPVAPTLDALS